MANILSIAKTGLAAAQIGMATTAHNIANQATPGYNRQQVIQTALSDMTEGGGYSGIGTSVQGIQRVYNSFLATQTIAAQSSASQQTSYYAQINKLNNMVADSSAGLSPVLQSFFAGVQDLVNNPGLPASRQAMLSSAESLAARFQSLSAQIQGMRDGVNTEITASVTNINSYAKQIAQLNEAIAKAQSGTGQQPNDLLDQRDYIVSLLAKETKVTVVKQETGYGVFIGNGQPLVIGKDAQELSIMSSTTDAGRLQVGYSVNGTVVAIPETAITGGNLGGLFEYRSKTLDQVQNSLGRIAIGLATTFNDQHKLGQDQNGNMGTDMFYVGTPDVAAGGSNSAGSGVTATFSNVGALTTNDYRLSYDGSNYRITTLPDNVVSYAGTTFPANFIPGVSLSLTSMAAGDEFMIRPTATGAADFKVLIKDTAMIAAAAPIVTGATTTNSGNATISAGSVAAGFAQSNLSPTVTLSYDAATGTFSGFPAGMDVTVTVNGTPTTYAAGTPVPYTAGATIAFGGAQVQISGTPADGDTFTIGQNVNGSGDNRNMLALGELQTKNVLQGGTASYNSAYAQLVSLVGNKTREVQVNSEADGALLKQLQDAQQSESGVNLDEEATNLLRYQQAYQAAGKVMQAVSDMFDVLIALGGR
ncbi:MAG: flagellar hook-associated protein FlgK [Oxalicibacterium faecigallinarum]|uniref:Flagellar hook-associated protein 1 n=1 Tax=Oxalicibacterium faecigallinarum TaxID=573741 RepID=A0A8J3AM46_9BURK|nr:flagellar hook-associated protein FlgK [Oxalicibacterium faecigallinarum]MDQ7969697.1 flagellar hook-associated protein FlgK [Oxalicibacterium faecigallinarum]GGI16330.1 flagellar hook-associated protein FlgK [Oxalicibacterium faecigallinarum]